MLLILYRNFWNNIDDLCIWLFLTENTSSLACYLISLPWVFVTALCALNLFKFYNRRFLCTINCNCQYISKLLKTILNMDFNCFNFRLQIILIYRQIFNINRITTIFYLLSCKFLTINNRVLWFKIFLLRLCVLLRWNFYSLLFK